MGAAADTPRAHREPAQLALGIGLRAGSTFTNLVAGDNEEVVQAVRHAAGGGRRRVIYFWGGAATGKTHLLEACCASAARAGRRVAYLPLGSTREFEPELLDGLAALDLVCVDDADAIARQSVWEEALFHLFNRAEGEGSSLILSGGRSPAAAGYRLPDLASRLASDLTFRLRPLTDEQRMTALRLRAKERGIALSREVASYILQRHSRDLRQLVGLLEHLDRHALAAQRRLTVPFVRAVIERAGSS